MVKNYCSGIILHTFKDSSMVGNDGAYKNPIVKTTMGLGLNTTNWQKRHVIRHATTYY